MRPIKRVPCPRRRADPPDPKPRGLLGAGVSLAAAGLAVAAVLPSLGGGFIYDDVPVIPENPSIQRLSNLPKLLTSGVWEYSGLARNNLFRPGQMVTYLIDWNLAGPNPLAFRLHLLAYHLFACLLVLALARRWTASGWSAAAAGLLFAIHPAHVESASWICGVPDAAMTLFVLGALVSLMEAELLPAGTARSLWLAAAGASGLTALMFKEVSAVLPALWLLIVLSWPAGPRGAHQTGGAVSKHHPRSSSLATYLPGAIVLACAGLVYVVWRLAALGGFVPLSSVNARPLTTAQLALNASWAFAWSLWRLVFPAFLTVDSAYQPATSIADPRVAAGMIACLFFFGAVALLWRRGERIAATALLWIPASLLPVLNANWISRSMVAERYLYLPSVGFCVAAGIAAARLARRRRRLAEALVAVLVLAGLARSTARALEWRSNLSLFSAEVSRQPANGYLRFWLGTGYREAGRLPEALEEYREAAKLDPSLELFSAVNGLPIAVATGEMTDAQAAEAYSRILEKGEHTHPKLYANLGIALLRSGRGPEAAEALKKAIQLDPNNSGAWAFYALAIGDSGDQRQRLVAARRASTLDPRNLQAQQVIALASISLGLWEEAAAAVEHSRQLGAPEEWCQRISTRIAKESSTGRK